MRQYTENKIKHIITKILSEKIRPISKKKIGKTLINSVIRLDFDSVILYTRLYYDHLRKIDTFIYRDTLIRDTRKHIQLKNKKNHIDEVISLIHSLKAVYIILEIEELFSASSKSIIQNLLDRLIYLLQNNKIIHINKFKKNIIAILIQSNIQNVLQRFNIAQLFSFLTNAQYNLITFSKIPE